MVLRSFYRLRNLYEIWLRCNDAYVHSDKNISKTHLDVAGLSAVEVFDCPEEGCTRQFIKHGQLLNHLSTGNHTMCEESMSLLDTAKTLYQNKLQHSSTRQIPSLKDFVVTRSVRQFSNTSKFFVSFFCLEWRTTEEFIIRLGFISTKTQISID